MPDYTIPGWTPSQTSSAPDVPDGTQIAQTPHDYIIPGYNDPKTPSSPPIEQSQTPSKETGQSPVQAESTTPEQQNSTMGQPEASPAPSNQQGKVDYANLYPDRPNGWQYTGQNLEPSVHAFEGGMGALGSLPWARGVEIAHGQPVLRATDLPQLGQAIKGVGDYVMGHWIQPMVNEAMDNKPNGWQYPPTDPRFYQGVVEKNISQDPLSIMDLMPFGAHTPLNTPATAAAIKVAPKIGEMLATQAPKLGASMHTLTNLTPEAEAVQHISNTLNTANKDYHLELAKHTANIEKAYQSLLPEEQRLFAGASQYTDAPLRRAMFKRPEFAKASATMRAEAKWFRENLGLPRDLYLRNTWGPSFLRWLEDHTGQRLSIADLKHPKMMKRLENYVVRLEKAGIHEPPHMAMQTQVQLALAHINKDRFLGGIQSAEDVAASKAAAKTVIEDLEMNRADYEARLKYLKSAESDRFRQNRVAHTPEYTQIYTRLAAEHPDWGIVRLAKETLEEFKNKYPDIYSSQGRIHGTTAEIQEAEAGLRRTSQSSSPVIKNSFSLWHNDIPIPGWAEERGETAKLNNLPVKPYQIGGITYNTMRTIQRPEHSLQANKLMIANVARALKIMACRDVITEAMKLGATSGPDTMTVDLKSLFNNIAAQTGYDAKKVDSIFAHMPDDGQLQLPSKVGRLIVESMTGPERMPAIIRTWERISSVAKFFAWNGFMDLTFGPKLTIQNGLAEIWSVKTPKDLAGLVASHMLAMHPAIKDILPNGLLGLHSTEGIHPALIAEGMNLHKFFHFANKLVYGVNANQVRAMCLNYILYSAKDADRSVQTILTNLLHATNGALREELAPKLAVLVDKRLDDPEILQGMIDFKKQYMGDYSRDNVLRATVNVDVLGHNITLPGVRVFNWAFLAGTWGIDHLRRLTTTIPNHPLKVAVGQIFAHEAARQLQPATEPQKAKDMGMIPIKGIFGPHGKQEYLKGWDLAAMGNGLEMYAGAIGGLVGGGLTPMFPSRLVPQITILGELLSQLNHKGGVDFTNFKEFADEHPALYEKNGKYYVKGQPPLPFGINALKPEQLQKVSPYSNLTKGIIRTASTIAPKQMLPFRTMWATPHGQQNPGIPTFATRPGAPNQMSNKYGIPLTQSKLDVLLRAIGLYSREF